LADAQAQSDSALSKTEQARKADEAARLSAAQAQWQEKSARALADAQAQSDSALSKTEQAWKADEAARLSAAQALWQEKTARTLAEATARFERAEAALKEARASAETARDSGHEAELRRLRQELAAMQARPSSDETAMAEARLVLEQARKAWREESEAALSKAEKAWKADEATRLAAAEARWQEKSASALAEVRVQAETTRDAGHENELRRLRQELAAMRAGPAKDETAMAEARALLEEARKAWRQESQAALAKAEETWKADEAARFAAAEAQWQETFARTLAEATKRFETAEAALKQVLIRTEAAREAGNAIEHRRLREELSMMQASLSDRETALADARLALEQTREDPTPETKIVLRPDRMWNAAEARGRQEDAPKSHLMRDMIMVGAIAASAIVFYPRIVTYLPEFGTMLSVARAPASSLPKVSPAAAEEHLVVVNHGANVRGGPSGAAEVVWAVQKGQKVVPAEKSGNWTHIRMAGENGKTEPREGWVYSSFLDGAAGGDKTAAVAERK
jgi:hypothetical protein